MQRALPTFISVIQMLMPDEKLYVFFCHDIN